MGPRARELTKGPGQPTMRRRLRAQGGGGVAAKEAGSHPRDPDSCGCRSDTGQARLKIREENHKHECSINPIHSNRILGPNRDSNLY